MAKFCGKCGTKLDESTGLCPNCNREQLSTSNTAVDDEKTLQHSSDEGKNTEEVQVSAVEDNGNGYDSKPAESTESREASLSIKEIKKQRKKDKKEAKKAKKKAKRAGWSIGKKIRRFLLKFFLVVLLIGVLIAGVLVHFDYVDVPLISDLFAFIGVEQQSDGEIEEFNILSDKFTDIKVTDSNSAIQAAQDGAKILGIGDAASELSVHSVEEVGNLTYYRLQQNYKGYPVHGRTFVLVSNGDTATNLTSNCFLISDVEISVEVTQNDVRDSIFMYLKKIVGTDRFDYFDMETLSDDKLCVYTLEDQTARLTYHVFVNTEYGSFEFFVDTVSAEILFCNEDVVYMQKEFTFPGQTDTHTFTAESSQEYNEMYYLSDSGTKVTIHIPSNGHDYDWYYDGNADIVRWKDGENPDKSAVDAIYNISSVYRYYKGTFGRDSFSNQKEDINVYVHTIGYRNWSGQDVNHVNNAYFWKSPNGPIISITQKYNSDNELVTDYGAELDAIGHEFTHGVVDYTCALSNTSNNKMPSAINEAVADIMGYCIEADVLSQDIDWTCSVRTSIKSNNNNPANVYHFDDYAGHEEEHSASTIVSYAAYLMNTASSNEDYALLYYKFTDGTWSDGDFGGSTVDGGNAFICEWGDYSIEQHEVSGERNVVLTLDVSGSMSGTPLEETKKASSKFINTVLEQDASIGVVTYDDESYMASDFSTDKASLQSIVSGLYDGGGTNIEAGLRNAQSMLERTNAKKKIIVLMSDGEPNDGLVDEELIEYAAEIKKTGTIIYTIGFFESLSEKSYAQYLMEQIASDGCHYEVADADQLSFFFEDMADQINGQKYIYVRIACPVDVSVSYDGETLDSSEKNLNARTSFGTLTFEENSEKLEAGIDDRVKVLRLKEGTDYDLKIVGTGHGIMNYSIGFMDENGEYSDLRKFKNIKITRKTRIDTEASNSDSSILNIDEDGDGKYDIRLKAEANGYGEEITTSNWIIYVIIGAVAFVMLDIIAIVIYTKMKKRRGE